MKIGLDIDGVLTDIHGFNFRHAPSYFKRKYDREIANEDPHDIRDIFKCPENEWFAYWKKYLIKYVLVEPARKGAKAFTERLRRDGHEVLIISKRAFTCRQDFMGKAMRAAVRNWLWRNGIQYCELIFCDHEIPDSKRAVCQDKCVGILIDDEPLNIKAVASIARAICFDTSYNKECEGENIYRARDFDEAYDLIQKVGGLV